MNSRAKQDPCAFSDHEDWKSALFEDCIDNIVYTKKVKRRDFLSEGRFPIVSQEEGQVNGYWDNDTDLFKIERPVLVFGDHTRIEKYIDFDFVIGADGVKILCPKEFILPRFFYYQLLAQDIESLGYARHYRILKELYVRYPTMREQQRIVGILDEAFEAIAIAKAKTEQNRQNARALFESYMYRIFVRRDSSWVETCLGKLCEFEDGDRGKNYPNRSEYVASGIPWINTGHIRPDGSLSQEEMNFISREKFASLRSGKIRRGDLVYCLRGATLGKTAAVEPFTEGAVASSLVIIRPGGQIDSRFLYRFLTSPYCREQIELYKNGAAQPNLGSKSVAKFRVSLPRRKEQEVITRRLDEISIETQHLDALYTRKLAALDELKASLLHQAFSGQL